MAIFFLIRTLCAKNKSTISFNSDFFGKQKLMINKIYINTFIYRFGSEIPPIVNLRLKIEINCREHFSVLGYKKIEHKIENSLVNGSFNITSFEIEEMLGTKMRTLYQRKKGRDLFDLYHALSYLDINTETVVKSYKEYIAYSVKKPPTQKQFIVNMEEKLQDPDFEGDIYALLRPGIAYDQNKGYELIKTELIDKL